MHYKSSPKILAIDPGTREMGVAFMEGDSLVYHGVKTFPVKGSPHERLKLIRTTILRLMNDLNPGILVVEKTFFGRNRNATLLNVLSDEILAIGRKQKLQVFSFAPSTVKKAICGNGRASKQEVARVIVSHYPALKVFLSQDRKWKERFHANMFDAVALSLMATNFSKNNT